LSGRTPEEEFKKSSPRGKELVFVLADISREGSAMNGMRKWLCFLFAGLLATLALPAAAQKVYTFNLSPSSLAVGVTGQSLTGSMNNISPDTGNSTIKSFKLFAPAGITITAPASGVLVPLGNGYTATIQNNGTSIYVSNINIPLKPFGTLLVLSMTVDVSCSATGGNWTIQGPWNGGTFTGQTFTQQAPSNLTTNVTGACTYSTAFLNQPHKTFAGYPITDTTFNNPVGNPIQVELTLNGGVPPSTLVTLTSACSLSGNSASTDNSGVATFSNLSVTTAAVGCTLTASFGTSAATSLPFDIVAPDGTLVCATGAASSQPPTIPPLDPLSTTPPPSDGQTGWALARGVNTNGNCGVKVPFSFSCDPVARTCLFTEDSLGQHPSVEYIILWPKVDVTTDPTADKQPCVSWGIAPPLDPGPDPLVCGGDYVPGLACTTDNVNGGAAVMPTIPNIPPFTGNAHPQYLPGQPAKVCIAQHGFTSGTSDANGNAIGFVIYWTKVIDQSDVVVRLP
jgi:hypothetical protein